MDENDNNQIDDTGVEEVVSGNVPYSLDFTGADKIIVTKRGMSGDDFVNEEKIITESEIIEEIKLNISKLPKNGSKMISMKPVETYDVVAYNGDNVISSIVFYGSMLKAENGGFYSEPDGENVDEIEKTLFALISN